MRKKLYFKKSGKGSRTLVLFHGFGQTHLAFEKVSSHFEKDFTIYAFDLYYHGKSTRTDKHLLFSGWKKDFREFLKNEKIERFSIVAFSLGGRFALATAMMFPERLDKLILIAPDGIYRNFWFLFASSKIGNPVFRYMMYHPKRFYKLLDFFEKWRLASHSMIRFARRELANQDNCLLVYRSWTYFRRLQLSPSEVTRMVNQHQIEVHVILGEKDNIIPVKAILPKLVHMKNLKSHILPLKHHHLIDGATDLVRSLLKNSH